jgi:hypothetical protein
LRFPCGLTWTASIGLGQLPGIGVHGAPFQYPARPRTGLDCRVVSSPEGQRTIITETHGPLDIVR